jgi:hypothetical protein
MNKRTKVLTCFLSVIILLVLIGIVPVGAMSLNDPGDVDGNGVITASDARLALRYSAKLITLTQEQQRSADIDKDGHVTASDARTILRISAKLEPIPSTESPNFNDSDARIEIGEATARLSLIEGETSMMVKSGTQKVIMYFPDFYDKLGMQIVTPTTFPDFYDSYHGDESELKVEKTSGGCKVTANQVTIYSGKNLLLIHYFPDDAEFPIEYFIDIFGV